MDFLIELLAEVFGEIIVESLSYVTLPKWLRRSVFVIFLLGIIALLVYGFYRLGWILLQILLCVAALALFVMIGYTIHYIRRYGNLRQAQKEDLPAVMRLYRSVIGSPGCNWSVSYPNEANLYEDFNSGNLYVLCKRKQIIGAGSIVPKNELDDLDCWRYRENVREIARIVIAPESQSKGHSKVTLRRLCRISRKQGVQAIHLLVSTENYHAIRLYRNAGFFGRAQCTRYGHMYYAMEKKLHK